MLCCIYYSVYYNIYTYPSTVYVLSCLAEFLITLILKVFPLLLPLYGSPVSCFMCCTCLGAKLAPTHHLAPFLCVLILFLRM